MRFFGSKLEERYKTQIYSFLTALSGKDWEKLQSFLSDNTTLSWGPYTFDGREQILTWAKELLELFPTMGFQEKALEVRGTTAKHEFIIVFITSDGQKGFLPCIGNYNFKDDIINNLKISLLPGVLAVDGKDMEKIKPTT